ncbi:FAD-dependent monooxygenase [Streptomyces sp. NPDC049916]|uniref:FAD-dependent monooxygenase n=1 Tax=Streptomyces sp. NPDC049916 TaxID=3155156 RepID=UPI0034387F11
MDGTLREGQASSPISVVVVGGGLGGSACAAFLAWAGIDCVLMERHPSPRARPRAWIVSPQVVELMRGLGSAGEIAERGAAGAWHMVKTTTLADAPAGPPSEDESTRVSAGGAAVCDQDVLEDILRGHAIRHGADIRWGQTVTYLTPRPEGVDVYVEGSGSLRARYVVIAEGARAQLLAPLGITTTVPDGGSSTPEQEFDQVLFRSRGLDTLMDGVPGNAFVCTDTGAMVFRRSLGRWQIQRQGARITDVTRDIGDAAGRSVDTEVLDQSTWTPSARAASRYRQGRVFLIGDSARSFPPSLGMGGNLAITDAHNLAWKLAWILTGRAGEALLDTYQQEREPVGTFIMNASIALTRGHRVADQLTIQLGLGYPPAASTALIGPGQHVTLNDPRLGSHIVGGRLPHRWLPDGRATCDLTANDSFAALGSANLPDLPVPYTRIPDPDSRHDPDKVWLVRPDNHIAAHLHPDQIPSALTTILSN